MVENPPNPDEAGPIKDRPVKDRSIKDRSINDRSIDGAQPPSRPPWVALSLPLVMAVAMLFVSPNFQPSTSPRSTPLGGDFLQDWVGGAVIVSPDADRLYDSEYVQAVQHDPDFVGFQWPEENYFPMVYPPFYYALVSPWAAIEYPWSARLWAVCSALAFSLAGWLVYQYFPPARPRLAVSLLVALAFVPLISCFSMGQKSTWLLLILTGTYLLLYNRRPFWGGLFFGLIVFKPHLGIVIGVALLLKRQWSFAAGALLMVAVVYGVSFWLTPELWRDYLGVVTRMKDYVQTGGYDLADSHSLWGAAQLTLGGLNPTWVKIIAGVGGLGVIGIVAYLLRGRLDPGSPDFARQFSGLVIATVMLSPHFYSYDLTILLLPMLLIGSTSTALTDQSRSQVDKTLGWVLVGIFVLAGLFTPIAAVIKFQLSLVFLVAVMVLLGVRRFERPIRWTTFSSSGRPVRSLGS